MKRCSVLFGILVSLSSCTDGQTDPNPSDTGCEVALSYAEQFAGEAGAEEALAARSIAFETPVGWIPTQEELDTIEAEDPDILSEPDYELLAAAVRHRELSVLDQCPNLRAWAKRENIITDRSKLERLTQSDDWSIVVLQMSMPVITADSRRALIYSSEHSGGLAGATYAVTFEKDSKGNWQMAQKQTLAIS